jgi:hypothetical protein
VIRQKNVTNAVKPYDCVTAFAMQLTVTIELADGKEPVNRHEVNWVFPELQILPAAVPEMM